ncbi:MAG TPA: nuclear transport factor 2 family protein [Longimicrobiales bacterium]|nr:nuclear transport factor 2 family protein [Longimicrobiales bacterium]
MLHASAASWNAGDLEGFLDDYLDVPSTAFVGGTVTYGVDEIRRRYRASYWRSGRPEQHLRFEDIGVRPLNADHALALGRYVLLDPATGTEQGSGWFTLVLTRHLSSWRIIHDHSSAAPSP